MDSFEWNKIFMAVGFAILGVFGINEVGNAVFHVEGPEKPGIEIAGVETGGETGGETAAPEVDTLPDFGTVLATADIGAGQKVAQRCTQCHTWDKGGANKIGPNLFGIVGSPHGHKDDFNYSAAMKGVSGNWDYAALYEFLRKPAAAVPGTKMAFAGLSKSEDRINLIAYIRTWADSPAPLPAPSAAPAPAEAPAAPAEAPSETPAETPAAPAGEAPATPH